MGKVKRGADHAIKKILMKEKSLSVKKKREAEGYHDGPDVSITAQARKDYAAVQFRKTLVTEVAPTPSSQFLSYNTALGPPFRVWLDTNFINFSMQNKIDIVQGLMDCLLAKVVPCICDCVFAELEKLGKKFRIALKIARDKRFERLPCDSRYADDCVVRTVTQHPIYIVATCDQELKRRLRKIPGVPIMYIAKHRYTIERLPEAYGAPAGDAAVAAHTTSRRWRSFAFYVNLDDPTDTQRYVNEELLKLQQEKRDDTSAYLHALLNRTLAHYQAGDYAVAHAFAQRTHEKAHAHKAASALTYFTALTCAHCAEALARQYEAHVREREAQAQTSVSLSMRPSAAFAAERAIAKLHSDAERCRGIATRLYNRPDLSFLRGWGSGGGGGGRDGRGRTDSRGGWCEDLGTVDADYEAPYGARWHAQRRRPEHAALRQHYAKLASTSTSSWHVPK